MLRTLLQNFSVGTLQCQLMTFTPNYDKKAVDKYYRHRHPFFEIHYVFRGSCAVCVNDMRYRLQQNQMLLIAPALYHAVSDASSDLEKVCVGISIDRPGQGKGIEQSIYQTLGASPACVISEEGPNAGIARACESIRAAICTEREVDAVAIEELKAFSSLLLLRIYRRIQDSSDDPASQDEMSPSKRKFIIDEFFNRNYFLPNGSAQLARSLCVSERQMNRLLLEYYGKSYREKLLEVRCEIGYSLLTSSQYSISDIAEILGYTSPANFSTFIKKQYGCTPSEIRRRRHRTTAPAEEPT